MAGIKTQMHSMYIQKCSCSHGGEAPPLGHPSLHRALWGAAYPTAPLLLLVLLLLPLVVPLVPLVLLLLLHDAVKHLLPTVQVAVQLIDQAGGLRCLDACDIAFSRQTDSPVQLLDQRFHPVK